MLNQTKTTRSVKFILLSAIALLLSMLPMELIYSQSSSTNYSIDENFIGSGGQLDSSSSNFEARASAGDLGVGNSASTNFQQFAGFTTTDVPYLEFAVTEETVNMGFLSTSSTATGDAEFSMRTYLSNGYDITVYGTPPSIAGGASSIDNMTTTAASSAGTEQFGMNLVANTSPATFGADPVQVPDSTFSFGTAATDYNTANQFKYVVGDTVATSSTSSGQTDFTASFIINVDSLTPGGIYTANIFFVATSTF